MIKLFKGMKSPKISAKFTLPSNNIKYYIEMNENDWFNIVGHGKYSVDISSSEYDALRDYFARDKKATKVLDMWENFYHQEMDEEEEEADAYNREQDSICPDCLNQLNDAGECPYCLHHQYGTYY